MKIWRDIKDFILSYYYPKRQYFLVSFPKTGRTWLMYMINQMKEESNHVLKKEKYFIFNEHDNSEIILEDGTRNNPLDVFNFTSRWRYKRGKVLFLARDPRDVVVSHFYQVTKRSKNPFIFNSISEFVKDDILGFKRIIHFYNLWQINKDIPEDFLLVSYEKLINHGIEELQKINDFLEINISEDSIRCIYEKSTANKMREKEINNQLEGFNNFGKNINQLKVRKAKVGGYKCELSKEDIKYCNSEMKSLNSIYGYKI